MNFCEALNTLLRGKALTISTAESCTGGLIAKLITDVPGASDIFKGSVVAYDNSIKEKLLKVPAKTIEQYGAVSPETVQAMAKGARELLETDIAVAVSGIAGPGGGSEEKPTGTVCFAIAFPDEIKTAAECFSGGREAVRTAAADFAVKFCISCLT